MSGRRWARNERKDFRRIKKERRHLKEMGVLVKREMIMTVHRDSDFIERGDFVSSIGRQAFKPIAQAMTGGSL